MEGIWLIDRDRDINVTLMGNDEGTWSMEDDASVYTPIGSTQPVRIVNGMRGLEGSLSGALMAGFGKTFRAMEADLYAIKERPYQTVQLIAGDMSFEALVGNITISPSPQDARGRGLQERLVRLLAGGGPPLRRRRLTVRSPAPHDDSRAHHRGAEGVRSGPPLLAHAAHRR
ncbi:hypothetical protein [Promicromonospora kroppenstedtii]|uniref:hypothetical protein n=1 Tax=Promicromonospora kroppenstedtii TaxID=440482 RepID=UPI0012FBBAB7|nr:hypothetical protein [Promicromonospora kroppenstedtii]